jgi:hypothetical protein
VLQFELAGQKIEYKDLPDLRAKLLNLLKKVRQDREMHDRESRQLIISEKSIQKLLGTGAASAPTSAGEKDHAA